MTASPHVVICVSTYRRPDGLRALLASLDGLVFPGPAPRLGIVVVDNDAADPIERVLGPISGLTRWPARYLVEPVRGVVATRNRALEAVPADADFVAFVDDDERVTPGWLAALLDTQARTGAAAVQGPVTPDYAVPPPEWIERGGYFRLGPYAEGAPLNFAATNNSLVRKSEIDRLGLRFDMRFNRTGGEDMEFFDRLLAGGGRIVASAAAEVLDTVPANRLTLDWVLRRQYRLGNTLGRIDVDRRRRLWLRAMKAMGFIGLGVVEASLGLLLGRTRRNRGLGSVARGAGVISAFWGGAFAEYDPRAVARDRAAGGGAA